MKIYLGVQDTEHQTSEDEHAEDCGIENVQHEDAERLETRLVLKDDGLIKINAIFCIENNN